MNNGKIGFFSRKSVIVMLFLFTVNFLGANSANKYYPQTEILCETNRSALSYQPGEEMIFTFRLNNTENIPENSFLRYTRRGDDGKTFHGKAPANGVLTVKTSLNKPGFVSIDVFLTDEKAKKLMRNEKRNSRIAFFAGAAVKPEELKDCGEPVDFDDFWSKQKKRLAAVPFIDKTECKFVKKVPNGKVYALSIPCAGPRPATGYLIIPDNAKEKSLAARIDFYNIERLVNHLNYIYKKDLKLSSFLFVYYLLCDII